jgi:hypothetical protein
MGRGHGQELKRADPFAEVSTERFGFERKAVRPLVLVVPSGYGDRDRLASRSNLQEGDRLSGDPPEYGLVGVCPRPKGAAQKVDEARSVRRVGDSMDRVLKRIRKSHV